MKVNFLLHKYPNGWQSSLRAIPGTVDLKLLSIFVALFGSYKQNRVRLWSATVRVQLLKTAELAHAQGLKSVT